MFCLAARLLYDPFTKGNQFLKNVVILDEKKFKSVLSYKLRTAYLVKYNRVANSGQIIYLVRSHDSIKYFLLCCVPGTLLSK